ncbi:U-box domain-containing protein 28-like [Sesbania bispinosa]|nr:U-box domain-containing protein 28-like [Sesbania bispinosa]
MIKVLDSIFPENRNATVSGEKIRWSILDARKGLVLGVAGGRRRASCANGRGEMASKSSCTTTVVERMAKASKSATDDAVVVLWSLCFLW